MKKVLAFLVLLGHINFTMFIPQLDESDAYDASGQQTDDINSLYEFVSYSILGNKDDLPQDEDDDTARYFTVVKLNDYFFSQQVIEKNKESNTDVHQIIYPLYIIPGLTIRNDDIQSPPPKV